MSGAGRTSVRRPRSRTPGTPRPQGRKREGEKGGLRSVRRAEKDAEFGRQLGGDVRGATGGEGEGAVVEHLVGEVPGMGGGGDAEVAEHGVGAPAAEKLDVVGVYLGAEEGGGATRAEAAGGDGGRSESREGLDEGGGVAQGVSNPRRGNAANRPVRTIERVDWCGGRGVVFPQVADEPGEGLARAEGEVTRGLVADSLTPHGVLLVSKREGGMRDATGVYVIQRHRGGRV